MPYLERECPKCGNVSEPMLSVVEPHIGAYCLVCGAYIKWVKQDAIPSKLELKKQIFTLAEKDMSLILEQKSHIKDFEHKPTGIAEQLAYWKLYLNFI